MDPVKQHISPAVSKDDSLPVEPQVEPARVVPGDKELNKALSFLFERQEEVLGEAMRQCQDVLELARIQVAEIAVCLDDDE